jgi:hypothetical protein
VSETTWIAGLHQMSAADGHDVASSGHDVPAFVEQLEWTKPCREARRQDQ